MIDHGLQRNEPDVVQASYVHGTRSHSIQERSIERRWVEQVLFQPEWTEPDPNDRQLRRAFRRIDEFGARYLRVVYHETKDDFRVVTAFFDRTERGSGR